MSQNSADSDSDCFEDAVDDFEKCEKPSEKSECSENQVNKNKDCSSKSCDTPSANCDKTLENDEKSSCSKQQQCTLEHEQELEFSDSDSDSEFYEKLAEEVEKDESSQHLNTDNATSAENNYQFSNDPDDRGSDSNSPSQCKDIPSNTDATEEGVKQRQEDDAAETEEDDEQIEEDVEQRKQHEALLTEEEKDQRKEESMQLKVKGNQLFKDGDYPTAATTYTEALQMCPLCYSKQRSVLYSNKGACYMKQDKYKSSIRDCTKAIDLDPTYLRAILRRAEMYEKDEKLDEALSDYQKAVELDPSNAQARIACMRLPDEIKERNEKMKDEMMGKLKELGNMVLKPFGFSTDNFKLQQDPSTGSYSVNFQQ